MIEIDKLSKTFKNKPILKSTSQITIKPGINIVMGLNGMGKTTLMKMMIGMIKPDSGSIQYKGNSIKESLSEIGVMFDQPFFYPSLTGLENLLYFNRIQEKRLCKDQVVQLAEIWGIPTDKTIVKNYSQGMKKRLSIAFSLLANPNYWFLDEPFNGLDFDSKQQLIDKLEEERKDGKTIILITHDLDLNINLANQLLALHNGDLNYIPDFRNHFGNLIKVRITIQKENLPESIQPKILKRKANENSLEITVSKLDEIAILKELALASIPVIHTENQITSMDDFISKIEGNDKAC